MSSSGIIVNATASNITINGGLIASVVGSGTDIQLIGSPPNVVINNVQTEDASYTGTPLVNFQSSSKLIFDGLVTARRYVASSDSSVLTSTSASTHFKAVVLANTGGTMAMGVGDLSGNEIVNGLEYGAAFLSSITTSPTQIGAGNSVRLRVDGVSGAITTTGTLGVGTVANGVGDFATYSSTNNNFQRRTAAQVLSDIGAASSSSVVTSVNAGTGITTAVSGGAVTVTNSGIITANNGLTNNSGTAQLGGTLIQNTTITEGAYSTTFTKTQNMNNTGALGLNGTVIMSGLSSTDATQLVTAGVYGAFGSQSSAAITLDYRSIYSGISGVMYNNNTGGVSGVSATSGITGWNLFANSGNLQMSAALEAKRPEQQSGQTAFTGVATTHAGLYVPNIRDSSTIQSKIKNAYSLYLEGAHDTAKINGIVNANIINATGNITTTGNIQANVVTTTGVSLLAGTFADGKLYYSASAGTLLSGKTGSSYDMAFVTPGGSELIVNPTGTTTVRVSPLAGTGSRAVLADASGVLSAPVSDRSVKNRIKPLDYGLKEIMKLKPSSFFYKEEYKNFGKTRQIGFIAQEVEQVLPNSVFINESGQLKGKKGYNKEDLIPVLVKAIQEQQKQIDELKQEVKNLKKKK